MPHGVHAYEAPALETKPAGQGSQVGWSVARLRKVPALQSVQNDAPRSEEPVEHRVLSPEEHANPASHSMQRVLSMLAYSPCGQTSQNDAETSGATEPSPQTLHSVAPN